MLDGSLGDAEFLVGAKAEQTITVSLASGFTASLPETLNTSAGGLGLAAMGVSTFAKAESALQLIDDAITKVDATRADLGAVQNRFQATIRNLSNVSENISAARARIRDTDFAKETAELTRAQILQQTGTTVLAQANQRPQAALSLLQG